MTPQEETELGKRIAAFEKAAGHRPSLPKAVAIVKDSELRKRVKGLLTREFQSTFNIWKKAGKDRATVNNYLNEFYSAGEVEKKTVARSGVAGREAVWRLP